MSWRQWNWLPSLLSTELSLLLFDALVPAISEDEAVQLIYGLVMVTVAAVEVMV
jgi:hypothetical protein